MAGKISVLVILFAILVGASIYYLFFSESRHKESCIDQNGRWVASQQRCQTRVCFDFENCLPSYNNSSICRALPVGISERELVFHLGQPIRVEGSVLLFTSSPASERPIRVMMNQERKAEKFDCGEPESNNGMHPTETSVGLIRSMPCPFS